MIDLSSERVDLPAVSATNFFNALMFSATCFTGAASFDSGEADLKLSQSEINRNIVNWDKGNFI